MANGRWLLALGVLFVFVGCGEPTLSSEDVDASAQRLRESAAEEERADLNAALHLVRRASAGEVAGTEPFAVDGMTAADVLAEARRIELRREKASLEQAIAGRREILDQAEYLAGLGPRVVDLDAEGVLTLRVRNGLGVPVTTGWLRASVELPDGRAVASQEFVDFGGVLRPDEERQIELEITGETRGHLPPPPEARFTVAFTQAEGGGTLVAKEPSPEEVARAEAAIRTAEDDLAAVEERLAALPDGEGAAE